MLTPLQSVGLRPRLVSGKDVQKDAETRQTLNYMLWHEHKPGVQAGTTNGHIGAIIYNFAVTSLSVAWQSKLLHVSMRHLLASFTVSLGWQNCIKTRTTQMRFLADQTYRNVQLNVVNMKNLAWYYYREGSGDTPQDPYGPIDHFFNGRAMADFRGSECHFSRVRKRFPPGHGSARDFKWGISEENKRSAKRMQKMLKPPVPKQTTMSF